MNTSIRALTIFKDKTLYVFVEVSVTLNNPGFEKSALRIFKVRPNLDKSWKFTLITFTYLELQSYFEELQVEFLQ